MDHSVLVEESERAIQPFLAPPLPSEALALASFRQVAPNLLLHRVWLNSNEHVRNRILAKVLLTLEL